MNDRSHDWTRVLTGLGAQMMTWGDLPMAATFGEYEAEYAAIHRHVGILHEPQRTVLRLTGDRADRLDFLHRLTTQAFRGAAGGTTRRALQLSEKGRIVADLFVHHGDMDTWLELDHPDAVGLRSLLESRIFAEDIRFDDSPPPRTAISLLGPATGALLDKAGAADAAARMMAAPGTHHVLQLSGQTVTGFRHDLGRLPAVRLLVPEEAAPAVYGALVAAGGYEAVDRADADYAARRRGSLRGRPVGWLAYNTVRIEAGRGLFHVDFGPDSLPAELGDEAFAEAVRLDKGCYLGQEIVARMHNLGHPRRVLTGVRFEDDRLPLAGAQLFDPADRATPIGAVTSSAVSPLLGNVAVALVVMKWGRQTPGTAVAAVAEGDWVSGRVVALPFR